MSNAATIAVRMSGITKTFGLVRANRGASLEVAVGEIHGLVGENGAGKSTLMRILSGMYEPDEGRVEVLGRDVTGWSTREAIDAGVGMVHQHFMLVPTLTVAENVVLGREPRRGPMFDRRRAMRDVAVLSEQTGLAIHADRLVADLSVGEAQRVEIVKTLYRGARILILDEPTAVLSPPEILELWKVLRRLREQGGTIVLITHKLDEVMQISDAVTVMRQGTTVHRVATAQTTPAAIANAMVGRDVVLASAAAQAAPRPTSGGEALEVLDLVVPGTRRARAVDGVSFAVLPGEILGIAGVEGNGQTELVEAIAGLRSPSMGTIRIGGRDVTHLPIAERGAVGLSHIPEDRHQRGLVLDYPVSDNLILGRQREFTTGRGLLDARRIASYAAERIAAFDIRPPEPSLPVRALSGGNQQKVVIAREMGRTFDALLAAQPTRGVDVGAIEFIHAQLRAAREAGKAILLVSAELSEVLALADRIAVMYGGRIVTMLPRAEATEEILGRFMTGARHADAA